MALTRKLLRSLGIDDEKIETIIDAHGETVEALKKERDDYKAEAVKVEEMTKQLNDANDKLAKSGDAAKVQADFDAYKAEVAGEKTRTAKRNAVNAAENVGYGRRGNGRKRHGEKRRRDRNQDQNRLRRFYFHHHHRRHAPGHSPDGWERENDPSGNYEHQGHGRATESDRREP